MVNNNPAVVPAIPSNTGLNQVTRDFGEQCKIGQTDNNVEPTGKKSTNKNHNNNNNLVKCDTALKTGAKKTVIQVRGKG